MGDSPAKTLEPGAIDRTRQNIGPIDPKEALEIQKKLGGEVLKERSVPVDSSKMPGSRNRNRAVVGNIKPRGTTGGEASASAPVSNSDDEISSSKKKVKSEGLLPEVSARDLKLMNKLMMSDEYDIKPDFGIFNFFFMMSSKNKEKVQRNFGEYIAKRHVDHIQAFIATIKTFIQIAPDSYKAKIATEADLKFRFLRSVGMWNVREIKILLSDVESSADNLTIPMLIPFVKSVYKLLLTVYYVGEQQVSLLIKDIYNDLLEYPNSEKVKLQILVKQAATEWLYLHDQIIRGMYPLLMRMCSKEYDEFPSFFKTQVTEILKFLGISKFDLLLPDRKKKAEKKEEEKKEEKKKTYRHVAGEKDELVSMGIKILEQLFPDAGFSNLESHPDLYPYFQPMYNFADGFNVIHPENPLQVTIILIRILEDFFKGCRNINFNIEADENLSAMNDKLSDALSEWASYHEELFDKNYGDYLRTYVNSIYSQKEYIQSKFGKETLNNIYWCTKFYFLPHFKFQAPVLQKPLNDNKYKAFYGRTDYIRTVFSTLVKRIEESAETKGLVLGVLNPWDKYVFDLPNAISKRIDVLLGAKRDADVSAATNANLIKYSLCIMAVLDWWVNNPSSPAYSCDPALIYRISPKDGGPQFSVPLREDQNQLFADGVKKAIEAKKAKK